jgi:restriction endonuclease Mrr
MGRRRTSERARASIGLGYVVLLLFIALGIAALAVADMTGQPLWAVSVDIVAVIGASATIGWLVWQQVEEGAERRKAAQIAWQQWQAYATWQRQQQLAHAEQQRQQQLAYAEQQRKQRLARLQTLEGLLALTPTEFELAVGEMLRAHGYQNVQHTGKAGDLSADLTCTLSDGRRVVVQCKQYAPDNLIGSPEIQKFIGMVTVHHRAQVGMFFTTSDFTKPAKTLAQQHAHYIWLYDGAQTAHMMQAVR